MLWPSVIIHATSDVDAPASDVKYSAQSTRPDRGMFVTITNATPKNRPTTNPIANVTPAKVGDDCLIMEGARGLVLIVFTEELSLAQCEQPQAIAQSIEPSEVSSAVI